MSIYNIIQILSFMRPSDNWRVIIGDIISTRFAYSTLYIDIPHIGCVICGILTVIYDKYL